MKICGVKFKDIKKMINKKSIILSNDVWGELKCHGPKLFKEILWRNRQELGQIYVFLREKI